jgi:TonB family protein
MNSKHGGIGKSGVFFAALLGLLLPMGTALAQDATRHLDPAFPNYQPPYPDAAQVNGEQGDVLLKVRVNEDGHVRNIEIEKSSGFADLDNAAIGGVLRWRYLPSERWSSWEHVTIAYRLPTAIIVPPKTASPR